MQREAERAEREAAAARRAAELKSTAEEAKRKHACLLLYKADQESSLWNEQWAMAEKAKAEVR